MNSLKIMGGIITGALLAMLATYAFSIPAEASGLVGVLFGSIGANVGIYWAYR